MKKKPIGIFDSGIGGLTVVRQIIKKLPNEDVVYLGDTARVPYGTRGKKTILKFSGQDFDFLKGKHVKVIVIACHTVSSIAIGALKKSVKIPLIDAVMPTIEVIKKGGYKKVGVIGTNATIASNIYPTELGKGIEVFQQACPLLVPLIEEGQKGKILELVIKKHLKNLKEKNLDVLVLACTHYPLIKKEIREFIGKKVAIIDPSEEIAKSLKKSLRVLGLKKDSNVKGKIKIFVTDKTKDSSKVANDFLGKRVNIELINL